MSSNEKVSIVPDDIVSVSGDAEMDDIVPDEIASIHSSFGIIEHSAQFNDPIRKASSLDASHEDNALSGISFIRISGLWEPKIIIPITYT